MYTHAFHKADIIVTVSETSKKEILEQYRVHAGQIYVAGNGWQHMDRKDTDETIFQKYPKLTKGAYYYYLASLAPNKNLSWILKNAAGNPEFLCRICCFPITTCSMLPLLFPLRILYRIFSLYRKNKDFKSTLFIV